MKKIIGFIWKGKRKYITILIVILGFVIYSFMNSAKPPKYDATTLNKGEISEVIYLNAKTSSANLSDIYAQSSGEVKELNVKLGDKVSKGDILMVLKNDELEKRLEDLRLERSIQSSAGANTTESAKLNYEQASRTYESNKALYDAGVISKDALDNSKFAAESAYETYKSSLSAANTNSLRIQNVNLQIERVNESIEKLTVISDIDGLVSELPFKVGDKINLGQIICKVQDDSTLYVNANVNQFDVKNIHIGQKALIYENLPNSPKYDAEVIEISPVGKTDGKTTDVTIPIKLKFDNSKDLLRANYSVKVEITTKENKQALILPYEAIKTDAKGNKQVFKYENQSVVPISVEYGISGDIDVEVISDQLKEGDTIILNPDELLERLQVVEINKNEQEQ